MWQKLLNILLILSAFIILGVSLYANKTTEDVVEQHQEQNVDKSNGEENIGREVLPTHNEVRQSVSKASWYGKEVCGKRIYGETCKTANGEVFDENAFTMACSYDFALGDRVELCYRDNCITLVCNDRGGFDALGRKFDITRGAFQSLAPLSVGVIEVEWEKVGE